MRLPHRRGMSIKEKLNERFILKGSCWEYAGSKDNCGYGRIYLEGKNHTAHTVAYSVFKGVIPKGLHVLHSCDNPCCINPDHLSLGTHQENMKHKSLRGRISGDNNPMSLKRREERKMK